MIMMTAPGGNFVRMVPTGFSWTTLFLGPFIALFRNDLKWAAIQALALFLTGSLSWWVFPFFYNKVYLDDLLAAGWTTDNVQVSPSKITVNVDYKSK